MPSPNDLIEDAIAKASNAMDKDPKLNAKEAARRHSAIYTRLLARRKGRKPSSSRGGHNKNVTAPQDGALLDYIETMFYAGTALNQESLTQAANRLLAWSNGGPLKEGNRVSKRWAKRWMTTHDDDLRKVKSRPIAAARLAAGTVEAIKTHFEDFRKCKERWGICDEDVSNFDETGHQIGVVEGEDVIIRLYRKTHKLRTLPTQIIKSLLQLSVR
jgi:hypothetical protein